MGPMADLTRREMLSEIPELILAAVFFVTGLYHLQLHRRRPELGEYLLFGLIAVGAAAYTFLRTQWKYVLFDDFAALKEAEHALLRIIEDILDSSKIEAGVFELDTEDFDLRRVVDDVARLLAPEANGKGISLSATVDPAVPDAVRGDPGCLRQALVNLVGNAVKFTTQGAVTVLAEAISGTADAHVVRFEVRDTGIGISPAARERLFRPFSQGDSSTTRRFGGTGLGLAISRRLVEMMGGRIDVASEEGAGSIFSFAVTLGRADAAAVARTTADAPSASSLPDAPLPRAPRRGRVLVAEDNVVNQKVTVRMLERMGFEATVVGTGQDAAAAVFREKYDAVLMDGQMPGWTASRPRRASGPSKGRCATRRSLP